MDVEVDKEAEGAVLREGIGDEDQVYERMEFIVIARSHCSARTYFNSLPNRGICSLLSKDRTSPIVLLLIASFPGSIY